MKKYTSSQFPLLDSQEKRHPHSFNLFKNWTALSKNTLLRYTFSTMRQTHQDGFEGVQVRRRLDSNTIVFMCEFCLDRGDRKRLFPHFLFALEI